VRCVSGSRVCDLCAAQVVMEPVFSAFRAAVAVAGCGEGERCAGAGSVPPFLVAVVLGCEISVKFERERSQRCGGRGEP
jgi:hypothetical protein